LAIISCCTSAVAVAVNATIAKSCDVAPERFENQYFLSQLRKVNIRLVAFDEAHCISMCFIKCN
jgi:superfamily II DNA helicase RecQ